MRFAEPYMFSLFGAVVLVIVFLWWAVYHRKKVMRAFAQDQLLDTIAAQCSMRRVRGKQMLVAMVFLWGVVALSRPQWGFDWQEVKRQGLDIFVAIDTSKSMLAQDVKPNRLERTKLAVRDLVKKLRGDRIGLVAFAGEAFLVCPLTVDYGGLLLSLDTLDTDTIPRGGTAIGKAIEEAMRGYENVPSKYKAVVIITDGENLEGDPLQDAQRAREKGIKVYCIGIGTKEGELIKTSDEAGIAEYLKDDNGQYVKSRLNEDMLQKIALATQGVYVRASGAQFGLDTIYEQELSKLEKRDIESKMEKRYHERFQIPLAIALLLLVVETGLTTYRGRTT